ncbi:MAG: NAD(P)/FAD-dependent oxidoreductase [Desulfobacteraceae bacterium]|nr:NAD(P)/FAD-dependent oxidoreductase [Desulfobacteraceae bacterium]
MNKYLIIGNGVAGATAAQEIRKNDPDGRVVMVTEETTPFYSRIRLPDYVAGITEKSDLIIRKDQWYIDQKIDLKTGTTIVDIDHANKQAKDQVGNVFEYDSLLISTGSQSFIPPIKGNTKENVFALRTFEDAENIVKSIDNARNVVLIGGGLLGLEAAYALIKKGLTVTVVEFFDRLLPRQMDNQGALLLKEILEGQGFLFRLGAKTKEIKGDKAVTGVELESGEVLDADIVLFSAGVRPNLNLAEMLGLEIERGIVVDAHMGTSLDGVYAAGDVAQFEQTNFCIWSEAQGQGKVAGTNMAGNPGVFEPIVPSTRLKVAGIDLASAGDIDPEDALESEIEKSDQVYRKIVKKNGKLVGCIMLGDMKGYSNVVKQIAAK